MYYKKNNNIVLLLKKNQCNPSCILTMQSKYKKKKKKNIWKHSSNWLFPQVSTTVSCVYLIVKYYSLVYLKRFAVTKMLFENAV